MPVRRWLPAILFVTPSDGPLLRCRQTGQRRLVRRQAYDRAVELEGRGNYAAALSLLWEASGLAPRDADVQNRLGEALERIGALDAAVDAYRRALAERPAFRKAVEQPDPRAGQGRARAPKRWSGRARSSRRRPAIRIATSRSASRSRNRTSTARSQTFRSVLELAPRHTLARYNLALVLRRADRLPEALAELERALAIEPRAEAHYTLGIIYWQQGDLDRAATRAARGGRGRAALRRCALRARLGPESAGATGRGAAAALRRAIALRPDLPAAHYTLGQVLQLDRRRGGRAQRSSTKPNDCAGAPSSSTKRSSGRRSASRSSERGRSRRRAAISSGARRRSSSVRARALPDGPGARAAGPARRLARGVRHERGSSTPASFRHAIRARTRISFNIITSSRRSRLPPCNR